MDKEEIKQRLLALNDPWKCAAFASRMALLALPALAINIVGVKKKPFLWFWKEDDREQYLLIVLRSWQLAWSATYLKNHEIARIAFSNNIKATSVYAHLNAYRETDRIASYATYAISTAVATVATASNINYLGSNIVDISDNLANIATYIPDEHVLSFFSSLEKMQPSDFLKQPSEVIFSNLHDQFIHGLKEFANGFDIYWLNWYQDRLMGKLLNLTPLKTQIFLNPEYDTNPTDINEHLLYQLRQSNLYIKNTALNNIGRFENLEIPLAPTEENRGNITVIVGNNGAGKTSILKSLATAFSWFIARLRSEKGSGSPISEDSILNDANGAMITIETAENLQWTIAKTRRGRKSKYTSELAGVTTIAEFYRNALSTNKEQNLPLVVFYPVERTVLDISLKIKEKSSFSQLDGYEDALNQGINFQHFFEWFREREDSENETGLSDEVLAMLEREANIKPDSEIGKKLTLLKSSTKDRQLTAVRTAITRFMPDFSNLKVRRKPRLYMSIDKQGKTLNVAQLSQGEKSLMALVGDIARRLAMMNPALENPLEGSGIVLIDEVDMHLHPQWQRSLIKQLTSTFPNCQFLLTTHSPLVISDSKDVLVYVLDDGELRKLPPLYGEDANSVLLSVMGTNVRNAEVNKQLGDLLDAIHDADLERARSLLAELEKDLSADNLELGKARLFLRKQELRREKNQ